MKDYIGFALYIGLRHWLCRAISIYIRQSQYEYWDEHGNGALCTLCGRKVEFRHRSIDHIIPKSICYELGLYKLLFDPVNFRISHKLCNAKRGNDISDLPQSIIAKLIDKGYTPIS